LSVLICRQLLVLSIYIDRLRLAERRAHEDEEDRVERHLSIKDSPAFHFTAESKNNKNTTTVQLNVDVPLDVCDGLFSGWGALSRSLLVVVVVRCVWVCVLPAAVL
jgi:hypothetical protein